MGILLRACLITFLDEESTKGSKSVVRSRKRKAKCLSRMARGQTVNGKCNRPELLLFPSMREGRVGTSEVSNIVKYMSG